MPKRTVSIVATTNDSDVGITALPTDVLRTVVRLDDAPASPYTSARYARAAQLATVCRAFRTAVRAAAGDDDWRGMRDRAVERELAERLWRVALRIIAVRESYRGEEADASTDDVDVFINDFELRRKINVNDARTPIVMSVTNSWSVAMVQLCLCLGSGGGASPAAIQAIDACFDGMYKAFFDLSAYSDGEQQALSDDDSYNSNNNVAAVQISRNLGEGAWSMGTDSGIMFGGDDDDERTYREFDKVLRATPERWLPRIFRALLHGSMSARSSLLDPNGVVVCLWKCHRSPTIRQLLASVYDGDDEHAFNHLFGWVDPWHAVSCL